MAMKKKKSSKAKKSKKAQKEKKASKKEAKEPRRTRSGFILEQVEAAGKSGIDTADLVSLTDTEFDYEEGGSRMRVQNALKGFVDDGQVKRKDGHVTFVK